MSAKIGKNKCVASGRRIYAKKKTTIETDGTENCFGSFLHVRVTIVFSSRAPTNN